MRCDGDLQTACLMFVGIAACLTVTRRLGRSMQDAGCTRCFRLFATIRLPSLQLMHELDRWVKRFVVITN
jgi:hypothetical protein